MRYSQSTRYARWAATAALVLVVCVVGVYAHRAWQAHKERKQAPPSVPPTVQQRSAVFSFSKVEKDRTLFTVRASRATEFKEGSKNLLEDVWITVYGKSGQRFDNIHTQSCEYLSASGQIVCAGDVRIDLESAEEAREHPGEQVIHVATSRVTFDRESGMAHTGQPVMIRYPYGEGHGLGLTYDSREGRLRLEREVEIKVLRLGHVSQAPHEIEPMMLAGRAMEYRRESHVLRLFGTARARQGKRELTATELALELDAGLRANRLVASGEPMLQAPLRRGTAMVNAERFVATFHRDGWVERVLASGAVRGQASGDTGKERFTAGEIEAEMAPKINQPNVITLRGGVAGQAERRGEIRKLETAALRLFLVPASKPDSRRLDRGETLAPATIEVQSSTPAGGNSAGEFTRLQGQQLLAEFDASSRLRALRGRSGTQLERQLPGRPAGTTSADEFIGRFDPQGEWMDVEQSGHVQFRQGDQAAQALRFHIERATDWIALTGNVVLAEPGKRTTARTASYNRRTAEMRAEGNVSASDLSGGQTASTDLAPQPAHITADRLTGNASSGRVVYSGNARLWQGDAVIEADSIELLRDAQRATARGGVRGVFPQAATTRVGPNRGAPAPGLASAAGPGLWRVRAGALTYWSRESRALLEQDVQAQSSQSTIYSPALELFFAPQSPGAAQQLTRALATGGATVRQGERRGVADRAAYFAAEGKFVLSGGKPTLYDASRGTTSGRQLTFFFADDTIVVDSEEGSRTLTKHRVEK